MANDDLDAQIVHSPITNATIKAAMVAARAAIKLSGPLQLTGFNQGRSLAVIASIDA